MGFRPGRDRFSVRIAGGGTGRRLPRKLGDLPPGRANSSVGGRASERRAGNRRGTRCGWCLTRNFGYASTVPGLLPSAEQSFGERSRGASGSPVQPSTAQNRAGRWFRLPSPDARTGNLPLPLALRTTALDSLGRGAGSRPGEREGKAGVATKLGRPQPPGHRPDPGNPVLFLREAAENRSPGSLRRTGREVSNHPERISALSSPAAEPRLIPSRRAAADRGQSPLLRRRSVLARPLIGFGSSAGPSRFTSAAALAVPAWCSASARASSSASPASGGGSSSAMARA